MNAKYNPTNLILDTYDYLIQFEKKESAHTTPKADYKENSANTSPMLLLEGDEEEVKVQK